MASPTVPLLPKIAPSLSPVHSHGTSTPRGGLLATPRSRTALASSGGARVSPGRQFPPPSPRVLTPAASASSDWSKNLLPPLFGVVSDDGVRQFRLQLRSSNVEVKIRNLSAMVSLDQVYLNEFQATVPNASFFFTPVLPASLLAMTKETFRNSPPLAALSDSYTRPATITSFEAEILQKDGSVSYVTRQPQLDTQSLNDTATAQTQTQDFDGSISEYVVGPTNIGLGDIASQSVVLIRFTYLVELPIVLENNVGLLIPAELISPHRPQNWKAPEEDEEDDDFDDDDDDDDELHRSGSSGGLTSANDLLNKYFTKETGTPREKKRKEFGGRRVNLEYFTDIRFDIEMSQAISHLESQTHGTNITLYEPKSNVCSVVKGEGRRERSRSMIGGQKQQQRLFRLPIHAQRASGRFHVSGDAALLAHSNDFVLFVNLDETTHKLPARATIEQPLHFPLLSGTTTAGQTSTLVAQLSINYAESKLPIEVVLLVDRSGSMRGEKMDTVKSTLQIMLRSIPEGSLFNIVSFGDTYELLFPFPSREYNEENLQLATKYVDDMEADFGGTELYPLLKELFVSATPRSRKISNRFIFVLTDGDVENPEEVIELIRIHHTGVREGYVGPSTRVFAIGYGVDCSEYLVSGLAAAGGGMHEYMVSHERDALTNKVLYLFKHILNPRYR